MSYKINDSLRELLSTYAQEEHRECREEIALIGIETQKQFSQLELIFEEYKNIWIENIYEDIINKEITL